MFVELINLFKIIIIVGNNNWGYWGESPNPSLIKIPFFKNITIFGFNQHKFKTVEI
jgi:hypothetical protein